MNGFINGYRKFGVFSGRARRKEYWEFFFGQIITLFVLFGIVNALNEASSNFPNGGYSNENPNFIVSFIPFIFLILVIIPLLAVTVRRLHDCNHSGFWCLLFILPIIGTIIDLYLMLKKGDIGPNKYGDDPKSNANSGLIVKNETIEEKNNDI
jgi:uncharacterized membrane protein YhaH (DUF805 family)